MKISEFFSWFNREKITLLIASIALVLGAIYPWYSLPPQALETFRTNLYLTNAFRILAALFALIGFAFTFCFSTFRAPRLPLWSGLIAVLLFPYLLATWSPTVTFIAAGYSEQVIQVRQHVGKTFPQVQAQWKQNIRLDISKPLRSIFTFSIKDSRFFQISSWDRVLLDSFGYSNKLLEFIGRGWGFTVVGLLISLFALYLALEDNKLIVFMTDMGKFMPWVGVLGGTLVLSMILPNIINYQLDSLFSKGQYHQVLATSQTLASWYPPLSGDEDFLKRMTEAGFYGHEPDRALIYFAKGLERYHQGSLLKAQEYFQRSLDIQPSRFLVRGYLATTILNQGVNYFNTHKPEAAAELFEQALRIFPGHLAALYDLMLARAVNREFDKSALAAQKIIEVQKYAQLPDFSLLGQAYLHSVWASYNNGDTTQAWKQYRQSIDSSTWKKSGEANE